MERTAPQTDWALWLALASVVAAALLLLAVEVGGERVFVGAAALGGAAGVGYLGLRADPAWPLSLGLAAMMFSGNWQLLGVPVALDRLLIAAGIVATIRAHEANRERSRGIVLEPVHWVLAAAAVWAIGSAVWAGTLTQTEGLFGLLDRFGLVAFVLFLVTPIAFATEQQRRILLGVLVACGGYLGLTALLEALKLDPLVFPRYLSDASVGLHEDRARGPFVEAVANGMGLYAGAVAAAVGLTVWRDHLVRLACLAVAGLCLAGTIFTLTRGVWLATAVASAVALASFPAVRRYLLPTVAAAAVAALIALTYVPGLATSAEERQSDEAPIWVRENTNAAALRMVAERPIAGFGWATFQQDSGPYFEQSGDTPLEGMGEGVHNVFLSHASELGLVGAALWLAGFALAIGGAIVRRGPPELLPWRIGLLALALHWVTIAAVTPLPYALPTALLFTWAGVVLSRSVRTQARGPRPTATSV